MLAGVDVFRDFYVLYERQDGLPTLQVVSFRDGKSRVDRHRRAGLRPVARTPTSSSRPPPTATA